MTIHQQQAIKIFMGGPYSVSGYKPIQGRYSAEVAAAITGAITGESGVNLDSTVYRVHADHESGGIAEWRLDRKTAMIAFVTARGKPIIDFESQCWFLLYELENSPRFAALAVLMRSPGDRTITTLCWDFVQAYEVPNMAVAHMDDLRVPQAIKAYNTYKASAGSSTAGGVAIGSGAGAVASYNMGAPASITGILMLVSLFHAWLNLNPPKLKDDTVPSPGPFSPPALPPSVEDDYRDAKANLKTALVRFDTAQKAYKAKLDAGAAELQDDPTVKMTIEHTAPTEPVAIAPAKLEGTTV